MGETLFFQHGALGVGADAVGGGDVHLAIGGGAGEPQHIGLALLQRQAGDATEGDGAVGGLAELGGGDRALPKHAAVPGGAHAHGDRLTSGIGLAVEAEGDRVHSGGAAAGADQEGLAPGLIGLHLVRLGTGVVSDCESLAGHRVGS